MTTLDAVVVGSGPNGLAAAITMAAAGRSVHVVEGADRVGGGLRTDELAPGVHRDHCATVFPFAVGSPYLAALPLADHGVEWLTPDISFAHPLDGGRAAVAYRSIDATVDGLGVDAKRYRSLIGPLASRWDDLAVDVLGPVVHLPDHPLLLARFGVRGMRSSAHLRKRFSTDEAQALVAGCAGHSVLPLQSPGTAAVATLFLASAHARGWPLVRGGAGVLASGLESLLVSLGATVETGRRINTLADLPPAKVVVFDTDPGQVSAIAGTELSRGYRRMLGRFQQGPGVYKVDFLLDGAVPWANAAVAEAVTVHVGGSFDECAAAEATVAAGNHADQPFVLVAQPGVLDATRAPTGHHLVWAYCHVPSASTLDMSAAIERQIERFAPGFGDLVVERWVTTTHGFEGLNPNLVGGDITGGANHLRQLVARPRARRPYATSSDRFFLCSASTPPGGGVHGMCGHHAALAALRGPLA